MKTERSSFIRFLCTAGPWKKQEISGTGKNSGFQEQNYENYRLSPKEWIVYAGQGAACAAAVNFVFYRSAVLMVCILPFCFCFPLYMRKSLKTRRLETLSIQFKDAILILSSALAAGYSVENAFAASVEELDRLYGKDSMISVEVRLILRKIRMNQPVEAALKDFADRSGLDDVQNFTEIFAAARKNGGELMKIIGGTAGIISEKIRMKEEILTITSARRMEQRIMTVVPLLLTVYIEWTSPGFFDILYTTAAGRIIMTVCLAVYLLAAWLSSEFLKIEL